MTTKKKSKISIAVSNLIKEYGIVNVLNELSFKTKFVAFKDSSNQEIIGKLIKCNNTIAVVKTPSDTYNLPIKSIKPIYDFSELIGCLESNNSRLYIHGENNSIQLSIVDPAGAGLCFDLNKENMKMVQLMIDIGYNFYYTE